MLMLLVRIDDCLLVQHGIHMSYDILIFLQQKSFGCYSDFVFLFWLVVLFSTIYNHENNYYKDSYYSDNHNDGYNS